MSRPAAILLLVLFLTAPTFAERLPGHQVATFSIVGRDPATGEIGIAVASRFFAVGSVVPWARGDVGGIATQATANTSFGTRGLDLLEHGMRADEVLKVLLRADDNPDHRQVGIVAADGSSTTYTGKDCTPWAGGRSGPNYAIQGNILTGADVVAAMETAFSDTKGTLADRLYAALLAGDAKGGDSRGRQSAALIVVKTGGGYGGYSDRAIDIRVDDHPEPFKELGRLLEYAQMNYAWNLGWTAFQKKKFADALKYQERAATLAPENAEVLYDLGVIRLAAGKKNEALDALKKALSINPRLKKQASEDTDLQGLRSNAKFQALVK